MAGAFSGLLAYAIVKMDGVGGLAGWRWIFILEGLLTVLVALLAFFLVQDFPETAKFLTPEERAWAAHRLKYQGSARSSRKVVESSDFKWKYVRQALTDWQLYVALLMYWGIVCPLYGISLFLPTIVEALGYTAGIAQLLTVPIYITACACSISVCFILLGATNALQEWRSILGLEILLVQWQATFIELRISRNICSGMDWNLDLWPLV
jgi:hypothetical protein